MTRRLLLAGTAAGLLGLGAVAAPATADEGMWTFDNFPAAAVKAKYGVTIDKTWLDHVQGAAVRLSTGCSASVVSGEGLVLTNHHCVADCAQDLSTPTDDHIKTGFTAAGRREERLCPGMQAEILMTIGDVTDRVLGAAAGRTGQDFVKARDAAINMIEQESCKGLEATQRCQVITLYQGGQFKLYTYRKFSDVRLVFAPELATAFFGGDPDNFNFPRYDLDSAFVRLYEHGKPMATPDHLVWNATAPKAGDPIFVAGNPGATQRLFTAEQLSFLRNVQLPQTLLQYSELRGRLIRFGEENPERARVATHALFGIENSFKAQYGQLQALNADGFIAAKREADLALKAKVDADPALHAAIGDPWKEIAEVQPVRAGLAAAYTLVEARPAPSSTLYGYARNLVRAAAERAKPNSERLPAYSDARLPLVEKTVTDAKPVDPELEQVVLEFWLTKVREYLTADSPLTQTFLGKDSPEDLAKRLAGSRLADPAYRKSLWDGGAAAIQASDDPLIRFVLRTDPAARELRATYEAKVNAPIERAQQRIAKARFAVYGASVYPDATFSLRLSYGQVAGWSLNGQTTPPFTYFKGLYERATGKPPFELSPKWIAAQSSLNPATVFDISNTSDIIGGNSGSPLIDAKGQVIGAIFDGNIYSLGGAFAYDGTINRGVAVSTAAITEALDKVYHDPELVRELTSGR